MLGVLALALPSTGCIVGSGGDKSQDGYLAEPLVRRWFVVIAINYRLLAPAQGCSGANATAPARSPRVRPSTTGRPPCAGCEPRRRGTASTPTASASAGSPPAGSWPPAPACCRTSPGRAGTRGTPPGSTHRSPSPAASPVASASTPATRRATSSPAPRYTTVPHQWSLDTAGAINAVGGVVGSTSCPVTATTCLDLGPRLGSAVDANFSRQMLGPRPRLSPPLRGPARRRRCS